MKKRMLCFLLTGVLVGCSSPLEVPEAQSTEEPREGGQQKQQEEEFMMESIEWVETMDVTPLFQTAEDTGEIVTEIPKGIHLRITDRQEEWINIQVNDHHGWVQETAVQSVAHTIEEAHLVPILEEDGFVIDLRYTGTNNFMNQPLYPANARALLNEGTYEKLKIANAKAAERGLRIKVWDGYRPLSAQWKLFEMYPDPNFVARPGETANHTKGASVDLTLVDEAGVEIAMPTDFDSFTERAGRAYVGLEPHVQANLDFLTEIMESSGFYKIETEWWHYNDTNRHLLPPLDGPIEDQ